MPLIKDGRFHSDDWHRPAEDEKLNGGAPAKVLLPFARLDEDGSTLKSAGHRIGAEIANNSDPGALEPWFERLDVIAVEFPKSADGRGFSIATRLRRLGYKGELRASGHVVPDQYGLALACGFDTVEISEQQAIRQPEEHWAAAQATMSLAYQGGYGTTKSNILSARWGVN